MSGYAPERPRKDLEPPRYRAMIWNEITAEQIWASPKHRTMLWAFLSLALFGALALLQRGAVFAPPVLLGAAALLPPLFFTGIVPPRGHAFWRGYFIGMEFTAALVLLCAVMGWLASKTYRGRALEALFG